MHVGLVQMHVAAEIHAGVVETVVVRAADEVAQRSGGAVDQHAHLAAHGADVASAAVHVAVDLVVAGESEFAQHLAGLDLVQRMVAAQQQQHEFVFVRHDGDGFQYVLRGGVEERGDFRYGLLAGSDGLLHLL